MQAMGIFVIALHLQVEENIHHENQHSWDRDKHQHPISLVATICRILTVVMLVSLTFSLSLSVSVSLCLSLSLTHTLSLGSLPVIGTLVRSSITQTRPLISFV
jgi:hypothetical protein